MDKITRRSFFKLAGATAAVSATPAASLVAAETKGLAPNTYTFFQPQEAAFIAAAVARLIPDDELGPGALGAGVPFYIDKQLDGAWGAGERLYRSGPWQQGAVTQGYQLPFTPAELFRNALRAIGREFGGKSFADLGPAEQDEYLKRLQSSDRDLGGVPASVFFDSLWSMTLEGYFGDPVYGGNRDMVSWRMIGFPGAYASYYELVDKHGIAFHQMPASLADDGHGKVHLHPDIPATAPAPAATKG